MPECHRQRRLTLTRHLQTIARNKATDDKIKVHLITVEDEYKGEQQTEYLGRIVESCAGIGIHFTWEYDTTGTRHDRDITTDHGWKTVLSRGLDVFQSRRIA